MPDDETRPDLRSPDHHGATYPHEGEAPEMPSDPFDTDIIRVIVVRVPVPDPILKMAVGVLSVCLAYLMADIIFGGAKDG